MRWDRNGSGPWRKGQHPWGQHPHVPQEGGSRNKGEDSARPGTLQDGQAPPRKGPPPRGLFLAAIAVVRSSPSRLPHSGLPGAFPERGRHLGPVIFVLVYAAGVCCSFRAPLLTTLAPPSSARITVPLRLDRAMLGASAAFWIGRTSGGICRSPRRRPAEEVRRGDRTERVRHDASTCGWSIFPSPP